MAFIHLSMAFITYNLRKITCTNIKVYEVKKLWKFGFISSITTHVCQVSKIIRPRDFYGQEILHPSHPLSKQGLTPHVNMYIYDTTINYSCRVRYRYDIVYLMPIDILFTNNTHNSLCIFQYQNKYCLTFLYYLHVHIILCDTYKQLVHVSSLVHVLT